MSKEKTGTNDGLYDFSACIAKMNNTARKACFLVLRVPIADAPMAKAAARILGQPYDSTNFQVAYNALLQIDIYPDVIMERGKDWHIWTSNSIEEAMAVIKERLGVTGTKKYDTFLKELLKESLTERDGKYIWPAGVRSALVCWDV